jgi:hypothetical protein
MPRGRATAKCFRFKINCSDDKTNLTEARRLSESLQLPSDGELHHTQEHQYPYCFIKVLFKQLLVFQTRVLLWIPIPFNECYVYAKRLFLFN